MVNHHFWKFLYSILTWLLLFQMEHGNKSQETRRRRVDVEENLQLYRARVIEVHRFQTFAQGGLQTFLHVTWSMVLSRSAFVLFLDFLEANCSEPISPIGYEHVILFMLLFFSMNCYKHILYILRWVNRQNDPFNLVDSIFVTLSSSKGLNTWNSMGGEQLNYQTDSRFMWDDHPITHRVGSPSSDRQSKLCITILARHLW